jgi:hypothetical protein
MASDGPKTPPENDYSTLVTADDFFEISAIHNATEKKAARTKGSISSMRSRDQPAACARAVDVCILRKVPEDQWVICDLPGDSEVPSATEARSNKWTGIRR